MSAPASPPLHCPDCGNPDTVQRSETIHWCPSCLFGWHPDLRPPDEAPLAPAR